MKVEIVTLFPRFFDSLFEESILKRAKEAGKLDIVVHDLRTYCFDKHKQADDYRFGGGAGMLMKPEPFFRILKELTERADRRPLIVYPSPQGKTFRQKNAIALARENHLIFLCGHYKGIDQRVVERWVDIEYSLGDYVITGGEPAVLVMIDAATRMIPGVLGDFDSARGDSFYDGVLDSPHYTRPESLDGRKVPELLASGHHKNIGIWRRAMGEFITSKRRPDLIHKIKAKPLTKTDADRKRKV